MIPETRLADLNDHPPAKGRYVLYWMQASQRAEWNHALEYAIAEANRLHQPLLVGFGLMDNYPEANLRHYTFMLQGLRDVAQALRSRGIKFVLRHGSPEKVAVNLAQDASLVVCDRGYLRHQKRWRDHVADHAGRRVVQVETDVVVPVDVASDKQEFAARTLRPKIHKVWDDYLRELASATVNKSSLRLAVSSDFDIADINATLAKLRIDRSVPPSPRFTGGSIEARRLLQQFLNDKLPGYATRRNEPAANATSTLAAYLHFGQISPVEIAIKVRDAKHAPLADRDAYLEELIVRRELAINYVNFNPQYDAYEGLPLWARQTLQQHCKDKRPILYTQEQLENAQTYDEYWNAAQMEMVLTGYMHGYLRMYWGKKILEWKKTPEEAFADAMYLNNKYFLCGRDPNAYTNIAWLFGLHDRPWAERPIFGTIRYMNSAGLKRKFDMPAYIALIEQLRKQ